MSAKRCGICIKRRGRLGLVPYIIPSNRITNMKVFVFVALISVVSARPQDAKPPVAIEASAGSPNENELQPTDSHSAQILKPAALAVAAPYTRIAAPATLAYPAPAPLAYAAPAPVTVAAPAVFDIKASVPAGDAPSMDVLVTKEKVLAPVRATQTITPQITVQHPTKVNVEKVDVEVGVAQPYVNRVPVAPHYEIHQIHTQAHQVFSAPALVKTY